MEIIHKYFPDLSKKQRNQLGQLGSVYKDWNTKINVISRKDIENLYERHVLHSMAIAKTVKFALNTKIMDVGTGGGFPGIPLAILFPESRFLLVDSIGKKLKVVEAVANEIGLTNVSVNHGRVEDLKIKVDYIVSRAVAVLNTFTFWTKGKINASIDHIHNRGIYYLKGGTLEEELKEYKDPYQITDLSNHFEEEFFETKKVVYLPK